RVILLPLAGDECQHREHRLHQPPIVPLAPLTQFEIRGIALRRMEGGITQDNHLLLNLPNQPLKRVTFPLGRRKARYLAARFLTPPSGRVENWRAHFRARVSSLTLSIVRWVHNSVVSLDSVYKSPSSP